MDEDYEFPDYFDGCDDPWDDGRWDDDPSPYAGTYSED